MTHRELVKYQLSDKNPLVVGALADASSLSTTPGGCDLVELRLDSLGTGGDLQRYSQQSPLPLLVTARGPKEGGQREWSVAERIHAYRTFLPQASLIDIELRDFDSLSEIIDEAKDLGIIVIGSYHDFAATPDPESLLEKIDPRADLHKFALMAETPHDIIRHLEIFERLSGHDLSVMGMGPLGGAARPLMAAAGSLLNYGYLGSTPTAPNQWPAELLKATLAI